MSTRDVTRAFPCVQYPAGTALHDHVAVEAPLEIRVDGAPLAVLMRTPGDDRALAAGWLLSEGVIDGADDLRAVEPCRDPAAEHPENTLMVVLAPGCDPDTALARRAFITGSSCGLCGKATIDAITQAITPWPAPAVLRTAFVSGVGARVRAIQAAFERTGGLHAAAAFGGGPDRALVAHAEDIGRHNAVDKVMGQLLTADAWPLAEGVLWVSGRASYELVQKAVVGRMRALICVGAPSSMAVELATQARLTLVGFAREPGRFNVYAGEVRGDGAASR